MGVGDSSTQSLCGLSLKHQFITKCVRGQLKSQLRTPFSTNFVLSPGSAPH